MKKFAKIGLSILALMMITGFSLTEVREYAQVLRDRLSRSLRGSIPVSVELDRADLLLKEIDSQAGQRKRRVAAAEIALEEAETLLAQSEQRHQRMLTSLRQTRNGQPITSASHRVCSTSSPHSRQHELSFCLNACRQLESECAARRDLVQRHRAAMETINQRFAELQGTRKLLAHRVAALRARFEAQQLSTTGELSGPDGDALARVTDLADSIERELRISERAENLTEPAFTAEQEAEAVLSLESEVDQFLGERDPA